MEWFHRGVCLFTVFLFILLGCLDILYIESSWLTLFHSLFPLQISCQPSHQPLVPIPEFPAPTLCPGGEDTHFDKAQYAHCWVPRKSDAPLSDIRVSSRWWLSMTDFEAHHLGSDSLGLLWPYSFRPLRGSTEMRGCVPVQLLELKGGTPLHSHIASLRSSPQSLLGCRGLKIYPQREATSSVLEVGFHLLSRIPCHWLLCTSLDLWPIWQAL